MVDPTFFHKANFHVSLFANKKLHLSLENGQSPLALNTSAYVAIVTNGYGESFAETAIFDMNNSDFWLGVNKKPQDGDQVTFQNFGRNNLDVPNWNFYPNYTYDSDDPKRDTDKVTNTGIFVIYVCNVDKLYLTIDPNKMTTYTWSDGLNYTVPKLVVRKYDPATFGVYGLWRVEKGGPVV